MRKRKNLILSAGIICAALMFLLVSAVPVSAQECRIVRVHGTQAPEQIHLEPSTSWIAENTCVVWVNWSQFTDIKVKFHDGEVCRKGTSANVGFNLDTESCYLTDWMPVGGTSSLTFVKPGIYNYTVETATGSYVAEGKIVLKE
jgi:hypothetical protein